jgi:tetratricopeptide (TPR) repeat protein
MARRKNKKKQEETLIDLVEAKEQAQDFFDKYQTLLIAVVAAIVILIGGFIAYKYLYQQPRQTEALEKMYKAESQFARDSFALALENPGGGYDGFLGIIENYGGTNAANLAKYYSGVCYLNLGRYDDAVKYLKDFSAGGKITPIIKYGTLGDAYSELNDFDQAISYYKKAANTDNNDLLTPYYLEKLGLLLKKQGDQEGASSAFKRIKEEYPSSSVAQSVDRYITG